MGNRKETQYNFLNDLEIIQKAKKRDEHCLNNVFEEVKKLAYKFLSNEGVVIFKKEDKEDFESELYLLLLEKLDTYDPNYETQFSTYIYPYILGLIKDYIREQMGKKLYMPKTVNLSSSDYASFFGFEEAPSFLSDTWGNIFVYLEFLVEIAKTLEKKIDEGKFEELNKILDNIIDKLNVDKVYKTKDYSKHYMELETEAFQKSNDIKYEVKKIVKKLNKYVKIIYSLINEVKAKTIALDRKITAMYFAISNIYKNYTGIESFIERKSEKSYGFKLEGGEEEYNKDE